MIGRPGDGDFAADPRNNSRTSGNLRQPQLFITQGQAGSGRLEGDGVLAGRIDNPEGPSAFEDLEQELTTELAPPTFQ